MPNKNANNLMKNILRNKLLNTTWLDLFAYEFPTFEEIALNKTKCVIQVLKSTLYRGWVKKQSWSSHKCYGVRDLQTATPHTMRGCGNLFGGC